MTAGRETVEVVLEGGPGGAATVLEGAAGNTLLGLSRAHGVPHTAACGGKARCSTCRVLVLHGANHLDPPNEPERTLAAAKGLEPDVRLACQTRVRGPCRVRRLVLDDLDYELVRDSGSGSTGRETSVAVLFSDVRGFTPFAEANLPYDVVHALNRHFRVQGDAVLAHGGHIDKYIGDGLMALFGVGHEDPARAAWDAVAAALQMVAGLEELNAYLVACLDTRFEVGIGIHVGEAIVGEMGHPRHRQLTAVGDAVNVASRIESATKEVGARLLVSADTYRLVERRVLAGRRVEVALKGKQAPIHLVEILGSAHPAQGPTREGSAI